MVPALTSGWKTDEFSPNCRILGLKIAGLEGGFKTSFRNRTYRRSLGLGMAATFREVAAYSGVDENLPTGGQGIVRKHGL
jgi:hypothetical protein